MNKNLIPAVILASHTSGTGVIKALGEKGVPLTVFYYQKKDMGYVSRYVQKSYYSPNPEEETDRFIDKLLSYGKKNSGSILIPNDDHTLVAVSKYKDALKEYFIVAATDWSVTNKYIDKMHTYSLAEKLNIPSPKTLIPQSLSEVEDYGKRIEYPCIVKPRRGHRYYDIFKKKMAVTNNYDEMIEEYSKAADEGLELMLQELIPGEDTNGLNYNSYFYNGKIVTDFAAQKIRISPPGFGVPCVVKSCDVIPEVKESTEKILDAIGFNGYSCTEFKKDERTGVYKLIEVNGRNNRSTRLAVKCGLNFPWLTYNHLAYNKIPAEENYKKNVYWIDETRDILTSPKRIIKENYSLGDYLKPYFRNHVFAIFDLKDMRPFVKRIYELFVMVYNSASKVFKNKTSETEIKEASA